MAVNQGRLGKMSIAGVLYPVYDWQISSPRNIQQGAPVGNTWGTAKGEGLQSSRLTARIMCREAAGEFLSSAFWGLFLNRSFGGGFDDTASSTIIANSGLNSYTLSNCKAESFQLVIQKGSIVGLSVAFLAPGIPVKAAAGSSCTRWPRSTNGWAGRPRPRPHTLPAPAETSSPCRAWCRSMALSARRLTDA